MTANKQPKTARRLLRRRKADAGQPVSLRYRTADRVDAVVPAYNEESTIASVVRVLKATPCVGRVVVVSDGSTDKTAANARAAGADVVVDYAPNAGKTEAMKAGVLRTQTEHILFLDADLLGLTVAHVQALCRPVLAGQVDSTIGIFCNGRLLTDAAQVLSPYLSGQRVVPRALFDRAVADVTDGFGVEIALTRTLKAEGVSVQNVPLADMSHRTKEEKRGYWEGTKARMTMYLHILKNLR